MFPELEQLLKEIREFSEQARRLLLSASNYFHGLALAQAYNHLISLADDRTQGHPEVQRVPELRLVLLHHLLTNADRHINIATNRIFSAALLGSPQSLRDWQEAGYHTKRTKSNYPARLRYWKAIYDEAPVLYQQQVIEQGGDLFSQKRTYQSSFITPKGKLSKRPTVTYEQVIALRNTNYSANEQIVPWWTSLNYGTNVGGNAGYPAVPGLHFVEDAEKEVPRFIDRAGDYFDQFMSDFIDDTTPHASDQLRIESWAARNVHLGDEYIPSTELARIVSFGVPF